MKTNEIKKLYKSTQNKIIDLIRLLDDSTKILQTKWKNSNTGGGVSCEMLGSKYIEKAAVNFSSINGNKLPTSALEKSGIKEIRKFQATGVSVIIHPLNPKIPCSHFNIRFFEANHNKGDVWWFGGGFDLTPYFITKSEVLYWKNHAKGLCDKYDKKLYKKLRKNCDNYFYLPHRKEARGIGGIFYDQMNTPNYDVCKRFSLDTADTYIQAYSEIYNNKKDDKYSKKQREFQLYRRGRYVEFNLLHDRGTLFGLQSGGRVESILMSMPPLVSWGSDTNKFKEYEKSLNEKFKLATE